MALKDVALITDPDTGEISIQLDSRGNPIFVEGFACVAQQLMLMIMIQKGEFLPDLNLGTRIADLLGGLGPAATFLPFAFLDVQAVTSSLITMQNDFDQLVPLEDSERVVGVESISIEQDEIDPRRAFLDIIVLTADGENRTLAVPIL